MAPSPATLDRAAEPPAVVLGSGSRYRRELLTRILPCFEVVVPRVDETPEPGETPHDLAARLARLKAARVAGSRPMALVIGSDQVAECAGRVMGKPETPARAEEQLRHCAGQRLTLYTAVCLQGPGGMASQTYVDHTTLQFRPLTPAQISEYVRREQPLDCAGSFKFESLGAALFSAVETSDPTAIQGLPLLWLTGALPRFGIRVL